MSYDYNPDELEALEWLNEQYIWQILSKYENTIELKLIEFELSRLVHKEIIMLVLCSGSG